MGLFKRGKRVDVEVRVLETGPPGTGTRQSATGRRERNRDVRIEIRMADGSVHEVAREMWIPEWVGVEQLAASGRTLRGTTPADNPGDVSIEWKQIEDDVSPEIFAKLFHKQGPPAERLVLLEELYAKGQFEDELYDKARRELLAEMN